MPLAAARKHLASVKASERTSKTSESLADAIVACDAKKFVAGTDNTDWRKHFV